jgi:translocation and assembly module TamA
VDIERGERYSRTRLEDLQRLIQNGWWFSSVVVDAERDPAKSDEVPVKITVIERPPRDVGLSAGYGTDDGIRGEAAYRDRNLFSRGFDLQSSVRLSQKEQFAYADVYIPPGLWFSQPRGNIPYTDSFGVLAQHSDIENLILSRWAVAGYRHWRLDNFELRLGLAYQIEDSKPVNAEEQIKRALAPIVATTWRRVDNVFDPRRGGVLALQLAAGAKALASGDDFFRVYAQYQHWFPLGPDDQLYFRGEFGRNFTPSREHIPEDYLFRAGGSRSNRGYSYQSLGVQEGNAIVGGRFLLTGTAEYVHWLNDRWWILTLGEWIGLMLTFLCIVVVFCLLFIRRHSIDYHLQHTFAVHDPARGPAVIGVLKPELPISPRRCLAENRRHSNRRDCRNRRSGGSRKAHLIPEIRLHLLLASIAIDVEARLRMSDQA